MNIWRWASRMLTAHRRRCWFAAVCIGLVITLISGVLPLLRSFGIQTEGLYAAQLGAQHGICLQVDASVLQVLEQEEGLDVAKLYTFGKLNVVGTARSMEVGAMDAHALQTGGFALAEGEWPQSDTDILLENHVRYQLGETLKVGASVTLATGAGYRQTFRVCGFLEDYQANRGITGLPVAFITTPHITGRQRSCHAMVTLQEAEPDWKVQLDGLLKKAGFDGETIYNTALYDEVYSRRTLPIEQYRGLFTICVGLLAGVLLWIALWNGWSQWEACIVQLFANGAGHGTGFGILLLAALRLFLRGSGVAAILCLLLQGIRSLFFAQFEIPIQWWGLAAAGGLVLLGSISFYGLRLFPKKRHPLTRKQRGTMGSPNKILPALMLGNMQQKGLRMTALCLAAAMLCVLGACVGYDGDNRRKNNIRGEYLTMAAEAPQPTIQQFGSVALRDGRVFSLREIHKKFKGLKGIVGVEAQLADEDILMLLPEEDGYWRPLLAGDVPGVGEEIAAQLQTGVQIDIIVANTWNTDAILEKWPYINLTAELETGEGILFCPENDGAEQQVLHGGDMLTLAALQRAGEEAALITSNLRLSRVRKEAFSVILPYEDLQFEGPVLLVSLETAARMEVLSGVRSFCVYMEPEINPLAFEVATEAFDSIAYSMEKGTVQKTKEDAEFFAQFDQAVALSYGMTAVLLATFAGLVLCVVWADSLQMQRYRIGMLQALGMRKRLLYGAAAGEAAAWCLFGALCSAALGLPALSLFSKYICGPVLAGQALWLQLLGAVQPWGYIFVPMLAMAWSMLGGLRRSSVGTLLSQR